jgi:hypothetical protein
MPGALSLNYQIVPLTEAPYQSVSVQLGGQSCTINVYTKSINVPIAPPGGIVTDPEPTYENVNPVFVDLYVNDALVIGGVIALNANLIVRNTYFGFRGDIAICDVSGAGGDPYGVPLRLPPPDLRNWWQRNLPIWLGGEYAPPAIAAKCPGLGTRFLLTYWPNLP